MRVGFARLWFLQTVKHSFPALMIRVLSCGTLRRKLRWTGFLPMKMSLKILCSYRGNLAHSWWIVSFWKTSSPKRQKSMLWSSWKRREFRVSTIISKVLSWRPVEIRVSDCLHCIQGSICLVLSGMITGFEGWRCIRQESTCIRHLMTKPSVFGI